MQDHFFNEKWGPNKVELIPCDAVHAGYMIVESHPGFIIETRVYYHWRVGDSFAYGVNGIDLFAFLSKILIHPSSLLTKYELLNY